MAGGSLNQSLLLRRQNTLGCRTIRTVMPAVTGETFSAVTSVRVPFISIAGKGMCGYMYQVQGRGIGTVHLSTRVLSEHSTALSLSFSLSL